MLQVMTIAVSNLKLLFSFKADYLLSTTFTFVVYRFRYQKSRHVRYLASDDSLDRFYLLDTVYSFLSLIKLNNSLILIHYNWTVVIIQFRFNE